MSARKRWVKLFPQLAASLRGQDDLEGARGAMREFLDECEARLDAPGSALSALPHYTACECVTVLRDIISRRNEQLAGASTLGALHRSLRGDAGDDTTEGFWQEMLHLFLGAAGRSRVYEGIRPPKFLQLEGRDAGRERSRELNLLARRVNRRIAAYEEGLSRESARRRAVNRRRVLRVLGGDRSDWNSYAWQLRHIIRDAETLGRLVRLTGREREGIAAARARNVPFGVTPYYASLMDRETHRRRDHAIRAQVIPTPDYAERMGRGREEAAGDLDFMRETDTAPCDLVTRRYPQIAIFKPFNACAQVCVYCQRNWEIEDAMQPHALASRRRIRAALRWFRRQSELREVLITGGDPLMLDDDELDSFLGAFAAMPHIRRVRIGTRAPVVLPMRFTNSLVRLLARPRRGLQRLSIVTHFEHPYEVTPEARAVALRLRRAAIDVYNQEVFTIENSRQFETAALRLALKEIGVEPYYCFCAKGKEETRHFRVPIARILQERQEEARLTPGTTRTDEPVFNLPRLGKNYLRAGQDHYVIGILPDGSRLYEFLPWERNLYPSPTYVHRDVPIHDYLQRLARRGETITEYRNIWYYF